MRKYIFNLIILFLVAFFSGCQSDEKKIQQYGKEAYKYVSDKSNDVKTLLDSKIDLTTQKVYYLDSDDKVMVYDISLKEKKELIPASGYIGDYQISDHYQISYSFPIKDTMEHFTYVKHKDRLFLFLDSFDKSLIVYINTSDATVHLVGVYTDVRGICKDENSIIVRKKVNHFKVDDGLALLVDDGSEETQVIRIPLWLTDEEYQSEQNRQAQEDRNRIEEEERSHPKEVEIYIRAIQHSDDGTTELLETRGCSAKALSRYDGYANQVVTDVIEVPYGKMWVSKSISWKNAIPQITYNNSRYQDMPSNNLTLRGGESFRIKIDPYPLNHTSVFRAVFTEIADY